MTARGKSTWWVPIGLIALSLLPVVAGSVRLAALSGGAALTPENARYFGTPAPLVVHIVSATVYSLLGAWQFSAGLRRRHPRWHRAAGRLLVVMGLAAAVSALWMNQLEPRLGAPEWLLYGLRLAVGSAMATSLVLGITAARRRDIRRHRACMIRAYALGLGAGTQVLTLGFGGAVFGTGPLSNALLMGAAWAINLAVAEAVIRRPALRRARSVAAVPALR